MTRRTLTAAVIADTGEPREVVEAVTQSVLDTLVRAVAVGEDVILTGFGTFEAVDRAARVGHNPRTGESVPIPARRVPKFRPAAAFERAVADPATTERVRRDRSEGTFLGVEGTPTFFVDGRMVEVTGPDDLEKAIVEAQSR